MYFVAHLDIKSLSCMFSTCSLQAFICPLMMWCNKNLHVRLATLQTVQKFPGRFSCQLSRETNLSFNRVMWTFSYSWEEIKHMIITTTVTRRESLKHNRKRKRKTVTKTMSEDHPVSLDEQWKPVGESGGREGGMAWPGERNHLHWGLIVFG